jgi:hypothetical protein
VREINLTLTIGTAPQSRSDFRRQSQPPGAGNRAPELWPQRCDKGISTPGHGLVERGPGVSHIRRLVSDSKFKTNETPACAPLRTRSKLIIVADTGAIAKGFSNRLEPGPPMGEKAAFRQEQQKSCDTGRSTVYLLQRKTYPT